jgi:sugar lactone lactonase YvrE
LVEEVALPCANVTKVAFGGAGFRMAFVTTARIGRSAAELEQEPLAGGLFAFAVETAGRATPLCSISL